MLQIFSLIMVQGELDKFWTAMSVRLDRHSGRHGEEASRDMAAIMQRVSQLFGVSRHVICKAFGGCKWSGPAPAPMSDYQSL